MRKCFKCIIKAFINIQASLAKIQHIHYSAIKRTYIFLWSTALKLSSAYSSGNGSGMNRSLYRDVLERSGNRSVLDKSSNRTKSFATDRLSRSMTSRYVSFLFDYYIKFYSENKYVQIKFELISITCS